MNPFGLPRPGGALAVGRSWGAGLDIDPAQAGKIPAPARRRLQPDWQQIVKAIKARGNIIVTDPLTVGRAFGRPSAYP